MTWFKKIVPTIGLLIGIIFVAIGATITIGSVLRITFSGPTGYRTELTCDYKAPLPEGNGEQVQHTPEEREECIENLKEENQRNFVVNQLDNIMQGAAFLVVGIFFWIFFWKRKDEDII